MFHSEPHLQIRRPSPSTIEFIVSTRPRHFSLTARLYSLLSFLLRIALVCLVGFLVLARWRTRLLPLPPSQRHPHPHPQQHQQQHQQVDQGVDTSSLEHDVLLRKIWNLTIRQDWWRILILTIGIGYLVSKRGYHGRDIYTPIYLQSFSPPLSSLFSRENCPIPK